MIFQFLDLLAYPIDFFDERDLAFDEDKCSHGVDDLEMVNNPRCLLFGSTNYIRSGPIGMFGELLQGSETNSRGGASKDGNEARRK